MGVTIDDENLLKREAGCRIMRGSTTKMNSVALRTLTFFGTANVHQLQTSCSVASCRNRTTRSRTTDHALAPS
jgi:hypothetical protein